MEGKREVTLDNGAANTEQEICSYSDVLAAQEYLIIALLMHVGGMLMDGDEDGTPPLFARLVTELEKQPLSAHAKRWVRNTIEGAKISLQLSIDQANGRKPQ